MKTLIELLESLEAGIQKQAETIRELNRELDINWLKETQMKPCGDLTLEVSKEWKKRQDEINTQIEFKISCLVDDYLSDSAMLATMLDEIYEDPEWDDFVLAMKTMTRNKHSTGNGARALAAMRIGNILLTYLENKAEEIAEDHI